jgi:tetratricopeptide (TPR) repeat protein/uncharacterized protein YraI
MAHYQRREWREALDSFKQLRRIEPNWPGLDSLIDEASWFLKLEEVDSAETGETVVQPDDGSRGRSPRRWLLAGLAIVALLAVLILWQGWIPGVRLGRGLEREALFNRGQAALARGDYEAARDAFSRLAQLSPDDPAANEGLDRVVRLEQLALAYESAVAAIDDESWDTAEAQLNIVLAIDPAYGDARELLPLVQAQRRASNLFEAGITAYDAGDLATAIDNLERLADTDPSYQQDAVRELLFILYLQEGRRLVATPNAGADAIRQAIGWFGKALSLRPRNVEAAEESQLANQFLSAYQALEQGEWNLAEDFLVAILDQRPDYAEGQARQRYFDLLINQSDQARDAGDLALARAGYEQALALAVQDISRAETGLVALQSLYTPTPTAVPEATSTPLPTPFADVETETLNVRLGPGTDFPVIGQVTQATRLALIGRNEAGDWVVVCCVDGQAGWVALRLIATSADIGLLPVGLAPTRVPTATPTATATPTPTATHTLASPTQQPTSSSGGSRPKATDTPRPR